ncbi:MAG: mechanosensitive ion channel family protein [Verrucomicrobiae bacterium]|nr:mechanosensitive ion channel family protein [Verrucomicrobiae bacterium]
MNIDFSEAIQALKDMLDQVIARLPYVAVAFLVFILFLFFAKGVRTLVRRFSMRRRRHQNLGLVLGRLTQGLIIFVGLLVALVIALPTFKPGQLVQLLGLTGVAIGFAFRDVLQNFLAGIILLLTEPFRIEDQIKVDEFEGTVEDIQTRATIIRTYDGRRVVIPNSDLFTKSVMIHTAYEKRRIECEIGIGYGDDIDYAKGLIFQILRHFEGILQEPPPSILTVGLGESSVTLRVRWWITPPRRADALDARDQVIAEIKKNLLAHGVDLPFPTRHILFHDQTEDTDGDRSRQREGWPVGEKATPKSLSIARVLYKRIKQNKKVNNQ